MKKETLWIIAAALFLAWLAASRNSSATAAANNFNSVTPGSGYT